MTPRPYELREVAVDLILPLRHAVLRQGLPPEAARFDGDDAPTTRHVAAVTASGDVVGCATIVLNEWDGRPAWQLRGMAVADGWRGGGVGRAVLARIEAIAAARGPPRLWCNARVPAVPFYERLGWRVASTVFDIPTAGPHVRMTREVAEALMTKPQ